MATKKAGNVTVATEPKTLAVVKSEKQRYRVLRPIRHGKIDLVIGDLVDMHPEDASQLVATSALAPHVIEKQVSRILDLGSTPAPVVDEAAAKELAEASKGAVSAEVTAVEVSSDPEPNN